MRITPKIVTGDLDIQDGLLARYDAFILTQAGAFITLPTIHRTSARHEFSITNKTAGPLAVGCAGSPFMNGTNAIVIPAGKTAVFRAITSATYSWSVRGSYFEAVEIPWTPTVTFDSTAPTGMTTAFRAFFADGCLIHSGRLYGADGDGRHLDSITPAMPLPDVDHLFPYFCTILANAGATKVDGMMYADQKDNTASNRIIKLQTSTVLTDAAAWDIYFCGVSEIYGWTPYTPTLTMAGAGGTSTAPTGRYKVIDNSAVFVVCNVTGGTDGDNCIYAKLTAPIQPPDVDAYMPATGFTKSNTSYAAAQCLVDQLDNTAGNRLISMRFAALTDAQGHEEYVFAAYELANGASFTPSRTWGTANPATNVVNSGRIVNAMGLAVMGSRFKADDGNAATTLVTARPPMPAAYKANFKQALAGWEIVDEGGTPGRTHIASYIDTTVTAFASRTIKNTIATATDAKSVEVFEGGVYPVG